MHVVIDTNVLVSSLWSENGSLEKVISMVLSGILTPCYDYRILIEYKEVLMRPKFDFSEGEVNALLDWIETYGKSVIATPLNIDFIDEDDEVMLVSEFLEKYNKSIWALILLLRTINL